MNEPTNPTEPAPREWNCWNELEVDHGYSGYGGYGPICIACDLKEGHVARGEPHQAEVREHLPYYRLNYATNQNEVDPKPIKVYKVTWALVREEAEKPKEPKP